MILIRDQLMFQLSCCAELLRELLKYFMRWIFVCLLLRVLCCAAKFLKIAEIRRETSQGFQLDNAYFQMVVVVDDSHIFEGVPSEMLLFSARVESILLQILNCDCSTTYSPSFLKFQNKTC